MAELLTSFVQRRKPDWDALERLINGGSLNGRTLPELTELDSLYRRVSADLARAQSFYPGSDVARFLTGLVGRAYGSIYKPRPDRFAQLRRFYRHELPALFRREARYMALSGSIFLLGVLLGALVVLVEPEGGESLVPEAMREQLSQKKIWTDEILSVAPPGVVASEIATNNLSVLVSTFASGLTLGLGTVFLLAFNGVHLGSVAAFAWTQGMLGRLLDFIGAHGPVELSIIVIAGGAGLILGHALIEPGELPRAQALSARGKDALRILLGVAPMLLLIAFVEGYVSPGTLFPTAVKAALGLSLGAGLWGYLLSGGSAAVSPAAPEGSEEPALRRSR